jgi:hypothetical protein
VFCLQTYTVVHSDLWLLDYAAVVNPGVLRVVDVVSNFAVTPRAVHAFPHRSPLPYDVVVAPSKYIARHMACGSALQHLPVIVASGVVDARDFRRRAGLPESSARLQSDIDAPGDAADGSGGGSDHRKSSSSSSSSSNDSIDSAVHNDTHGGRRMALTNPALESLCSRTGGVRVDRRCCYRWRCAR